ncbi:hypothetical protein V500_10381 [Pseudogymnoascus sp. VKM F-4518 (FW-2643)]|nr:hypothetical protein V500_10381 [Pseudogymnoascus sp. VKM F-4518 (FW-2643)]
MNTNPKDLLRSPVFFYNAHDRDSVGDGDPPLRRGAVLGVQQHLQGQKPAAGKRKVSTSLQSPPTSTGSDDEPTLILRSFKAL